MIFLDGFIDFWLWGENGWSVHLFVREIVGTQIGSGKV